MENYHNGNEYICQNRSDNSTTKIMNRNRIGLIFLIIVGALATWFIIKAGYDLYTYSRLSERVPVTVEKWSIEELKSDQFVVLAHYSFEYQGKNHVGKGGVGTYPNPWAAQEAQKQFSQKKWSVWLDPKHPELAVMQKYFPFKRTLSALILAGLLIYFLTLNKYIQSKYG